MKTTLDLPDELMRSVKIRAAQEGRRLKDVVADLLRRGLAAEARPEPSPHRVKLPLFHSTRRANPEEEMTPERIAQTLIDEEASWAMPR